MQPQLQPCAGYLPQQGTASTGRYCQVPPPWSGATICKVYPVSNDRCSCMAASHTNMDLSSHKESAQRDPRSHPQAPR